MGYERALTGARGCAVSESIAGRNDTRVLDHQNHTFLGRSGPVDDALRHDEVEQIGLTQQEAAALLGVPLRTFQRWLGGPEKRLDSTTGGRYYRAIKIMQHATMLLGSMATTLEWLRAPQRALGFRMPLELLSTEPGAEAVEDLLGRIEYAQHLEEALSGEGARRYGGRWNEKGVPVVYLSSHLGLAALEKFVHAVPAGRGISLHAVAIEIAARYIDDARRPDRLPDDWRDAEPGVGTMSWGSQWARLRQSLVALVPSALLPLTCFEHSWEFNLLLNPEHEAMAEIRVLERPRYSFDPRMWKGEESSASRAP